MPSISPEPDTLENGSTEGPFGASTPYELIGQWNPAKLPPDEDLKVMSSIITQYMSSGTTGDSVVPNGIDNGAIEYATDSGYPQCIADSWVGVHPQEWTSSQVLEWLYSIFSSGREYEKLPLHHFRTVRGSQLVQMKRNELVNMFRSEAYPDEYAAASYADHAFAQLQHLLFPLRGGHHDCPTNGGGNGNNPQQPCNQISGSQVAELGAQYDSTGASEYVYANGDASIYGSLARGTTQYSNLMSHPYAFDVWTTGVGERSVSDVDSDSAESNVTNIYMTAIPSKPVGERPGKRGPGRPPGERKKKNKGQRSSRLWEFIRDLLKNKDTCPRLVKWEDREEGVFRFVQSDQVAKLWGERKANPRMTYEKLSRAMRYYYKSNVLQPVLGRRLVYKFGPSATGWRPHET